MERVLGEVLKIAMQNIPLTISLLIIISGLIWQLYRSNVLIAMMRLEISSNRNLIEKIRECCIAKDRRLTRYLIEDKISSEMKPPIVVWEELDGEE